MSPDSALCWVAPPLFYWAHSCSFIELGVGWSRVWDSAPDAGRCVAPVLPTYLLILSSMRVASHWAVLQKGPKRVDVGAARPLETERGHAERRLHHILWVNASQKAIRFKERREGLPPLVAEVAKACGKGGWQGPLQLTQKTGLSKGPFDIGHGRNWGLPMIHFLKIKVHG